MKSQNRRLDKLEQRTGPDSNFDTEKLNSDELERLYEIEQKFEANNYKYSALTDSELDDAIRLIKKGESNE